MSVHYFSIYKHTRPLLSVFLFLFAFMLFPFMSLLFCIKPADKWRENSFFTESEMLSHLFTYQLLTCLHELKRKKVLWREKTDSLQPHTQMSFNELVIGSLVSDYYAKLSECFTYSKWHQCDLLKLWLMAMNIIFFAQQQSMWREIKKCKFTSSRKINSAVCAKIHVCKHDDVDNDVRMMGRNRKVDNKIKLFSAQKKSLINWIKTYLSWLSNHFYLFIYFVQ